MMYPQIKRPLFVLTGFLLLSSGGVSADEPQKVEETIRQGEVTGVVSAVDKHGIAVEYSRAKSSSSEMFLPLSMRKRRPGTLRYLRAIERRRYLFDAGQRS